jgi:hypothetical protein
MTAFPLDANNADEALQELLKNDQCRDRFFQAPEKVDHLVKGMKDLQRLYEQSCEIFEVDKRAGLKLMFHVFFQTPYGLGMYHVFDAIGLYMDDAMDDEVCAYIREQWKHHSPTLSAEDKVWWRRECEAWHCQLAA